jgi:hypothetical protein
VLSSPAEQYPKLFGSNSFLKNYPYALPTFVTGAFGASAAILCALLVKEVDFSTFWTVENLRPLTLQTLKRKNKDDQNVQPPMSTWEIVKSPGVPAVLSLYGYVMLLGLAYTASNLPPPSAFINGLLNVHDLSFAGLLGRER